MKLNSSKSWQSRYHAVARAIDESERLADAAVASRRAAAAANLQRIETTAVYAQLHELQQTLACRQLLQALKAFADEAFSFFLDGYYQSQMLPVSSDYPPRTLMRTLLDQISFDVSIIQRAINQRWRAADDRLTQQGRALLMADRLADTAISPAARAGCLPASTTAVCYLDRRIRARLVPYDDAVFISIPFSSLQEHDQPARDFLAIPHEVGHHLYWNGRLPDGRRIHNVLAANLADAPAWCMRWIEEIFADAYALLIGGPVVALDFQEMVSDDPPHHFRTTLDKHPIPEIRPFIQTTLLRHFDSASGAAANRLDENWRRWLGRDALADLFEVPGAAAPLSGGAILAALHAPMTQIVSLLHATAGAEVARAAPWSGRLAPDEDLSALYVQYAHLAFPHEEDTAGRMLLARFEAALRGETADPQVETYFARHTLRPTSFFADLAAITGQAPDAWTTGDWIKQFLFQGWSDEGPEGDPGGWTTSTGGSGGGPSTGGSQGDGHSSG